MAKYKLTDETKELEGHILYRIEALIDFNNVKKGDKGGWIEKESNNLSQYGDCWVYGNAIVCDDALVCDNAKVCDDAVVSGYAEVYDKALVRDKAVVCGNAKVCAYAVVCGDARVCGNAVVKGNAEIIGDAIIEKMGDYIVFHNWWSSGRFFTYTKSNNMWKVGCFYGTGEQLIKKAYADSEENGERYEATVNSIKDIM